MSLVINNNLMATNVARNLNAHYGRLATSTQRLSSGLRINSAADDAAGLAIRELQRADIATLQQGARNANDAVSMIQVADGSLSIIDEKLIRMKELAEQAATGTYDSTQRLMIESEYQAMASEITRIANATDFNGIKLLDGTLAGEHDGSGLTATGQMKIHFGTGNDSAEDYYYVEIGECTSAAFGIGNSSTWQDVQKRAIQAFKTSLTNQIKNDNSLTAEEKTELLVQVDENAKLLENALNFATDPTTAFLNFTVDDEEFFPGNPSLRDMYMTALVEAQNEFGGMGWPTTTDEIEARLSIAINSVDYQDRFDALDPADFVDYLANVENAAAAAGAQFGVDPNTMKALIHLETAFDTNGLPTDPKPNPYLDKATLDAWKGKVNTDLAPILQQTISDTVVTKIGSAILNVPIPQPPLDDNQVPMFTSEYFDEYKSRIQSAARDAAQAAGVNDPAKLTEIDGYLNNIINAHDPGFPLTEAGLTQWKSTIAAAVASDAQVQKVAIDAGLDKIKDAIDGVDYGFNLLKDETFDAYKDDVLTAVKSDAAFMTLSDASLKALFADTTRPNGKPMTMDAHGIEEFKNGLIAEITGQSTTTHAANIQKDIADAATRNGQVADKIQNFWDGLRGTQQQKFMYAWGQAAIDKLANGADLGAYGIGSEKFTLGENLEEEIAAKVDAMLSNALKNMKTKVGHMDFAGYTIETQEDAQMALEALNAAIVSKDKIRSHLGATQNRLENTITNLNIMAENLQAAESRISDVDIATEMTNMVRNQILAQAATAMLAQANSLPQMAIQLIGG